MKRYSGNDLAYGFQVIAVISLFTYRDIAPKPGIQAGIRNDANTTTVSERIHTKFQPVMNAGLYTVTVFGKIGNEAGFHAGNIMP